MSVPDSFHPARARLVLAAACALGLTACAALPGEQLDREVRAAHASQLDVDAPWRRAAAADAAAERRVRELLAEGVEADEAVQIALLRNPDLQLAFEELGIARSAYLTAALPPNPVAEIKVLALRGEPGEELKFSIVQNLVGLLSLPARRRAAREEFSGARLAAADAVVRLAADTQAAWFELLAARRLVELHEQQADIGELMFELASRYHTAGNFTIAEREHERDGWLHARKELLEAQVHFQSAREDLSRLMGITGAHDDWEISGGLPALPEEDPDARELERRALEARLDVRAARHLVEARLSTLRTDRRWRLLPHLDLGVITEREPDGERATGPSVEFELPLFSQGQALLAGSDAEARSAMRRAEALALDVRREVRLAAAELALARQLVQTWRDEVIPAREIITEFEQREFNFMLKGPFDPLRAKREELEGFAGFIESLGRYWRARVELARSAGDLTLVDGRVTP
jgi:outer membrane protein, heavy metal efflux system